MQTCVGTGEFREWGPCVGGLAPQPTPSRATASTTTATAASTTTPACCIVELACPAPGSLPDGQPFQNYVIDGASFYSGTVASWQWDRHRRPVRPAVPDHHQPGGPDLHADRRQHARC
jgi:hypothetical protein